MTKRLCLLAPLLATIPTAAWAHPGHEGGAGFVAGMWHPLTGADHLVGMVLVGVWAGLLAPQKRASMLIPLGFLAAMIAGFISSAVLGGGLAEPLILLSLLVLGLAAAFRIRPPVQLATAAAALFGFAHGMDHGFETPKGAFPALFAAGFIVSTACLHGVGVAIVRVLPGPVIRLVSVIAAVGALGVSVAG
jgi:urease accessory protein